MDGRRVDGVCVDVGTERKKRKENYELKIFDKTQYAAR